MELHPDEIQEIRINQLNEMLKNEEFVEYLKSDFVHIPEDLYELSDSELAEFVESVTEYYQEWI
jgi:hypothetical protein